ncbi:MAG: ABC transporter permease [Bacteroidia bacterium]|nr:ABC transporter permease [Bacteroidia bacterium]
MLNKLIYNFLIALDAISQNWLRAVLTSLGIVFGVASVIAMLAIGRGTQERIMEQMNALGANNIIIKPVIEQEEGEVEENTDEAKRQPNRFTPGLTMADVKGLAELPYIQSVSPEIEIETMAVRNGRKRSLKLVGVTLAHFENEELQLLEGKHFSPEQIKFSESVCVIGYGVKAKFFPTEEPVGKEIKCGKHWLTVVGVMKPRNISQEVRDELGIRNYDMDIYAPIQTVLLRYKNRSLVTQAGLLRAAQVEEEGNESETKVPDNYHQIDNIVLKVSNTAYSRKISEISNRMLARRHNQVVDFQIIVPETLLQKKQESTDLFNWVLRAIASISLLVGGIGIMNIMLASVLERIKEIGLRLSLGATKNDIVLQFMCEAIVISVTGGIIGVIMGVAISFFIEYITSIQTIISPVFLVISFPVAVTIGLVFGIYPARQAARQDPVVSLRAN